MFHLIHRTEIDMFVVKIFNENLIVCIGFLLTKNIFGEKPTPKSHRPPLSSKAGGSVKKGRMRISVTRCNSIGTPVWKEDGTHVTLPKKNQIPQAFCNLNFIKLCPSCFPESCTSRAKPGLEASRTPSAINCSAFTPYTAHCQTSCCRDGWQPTQTQPLNFFNGATLQNFGGSQNLQIKGSCLISFVCFC